jgi:predicted alpha-1,6-mannanase (GH76 family)
MHRRIICLTLIAALAGCGAPAAPRAEDRARADAGMAALVAMYNDNVGRWTSTGWWNNANALEATIDYMARTGSRDELPLLEITYRENSYAGFLNDYYDDQLWWALAWLKAYDLTGEVQYLEAARGIFADTTSAWDDSCGGGLWWSHARDYKNAIPNQLFLTLAARLHQRTPGDGGPGSYRAWAERSWAWFEASGMINDRGLVNDGLTADCRNNGGETWTYNQGVILGGLVDLAAITGDTALLDRAQQIADAAIVELVDAEGVLREPCEPECGKDGPQFKGIFVRNLAALHAVRPEERYAGFLRRNAEALWANSRSPQNEFGLSWAGPFDYPDAARQSSAQDALNAVLPAPPDPRGS